MKIQIVSDLHLEFTQIHIPETDADIIVLAGDICVGAKGAKTAKAIQKEHNKPVLYVTGNHEYYGGVVGDIDDKCRNELGDNFLQMSVFEFGGVKFGGCTLWTDLDNNNWFTKQQAKLNMSDFELINLEQYKKFTPDDSIKLHHKMRKWLEETKLDVVITHHSPLFESSHPRFVNSNLNGAFASNLSELIMKKSPKVWIHGHMHNSSDYMCYNTRIVCNPRGYTSRHYEENGIFDPSKIIEI